MSPLIERARTQIRIIGIAWARSQNDWSEPFLVRTIAARGLSMVTRHLLIGRREMLACLGAGMLSARQLFAQTGTPEFTALDHIEFYVSNVEKSRDFFVR